MQEKTVRRSNRERTAATRAALMRAGRALFVSQGYAETGTPEIVAKSKVTRGALYHHFTDKADLLRAIVAAEAAAVAEAITAETGEVDDPYAALVQGAEAYFSAMKVPGRARLLLHEGPFVLGPAAMAQLDRTTGARTLLEGLEAAAGRAGLRDVPLAPLAALLSAAFDKAAQAIADGADEQPYRDAIGAILKGLLR